MRVELKTKSQSAKHMLDIKYRSVCTNAWVIHMYMYMPGDISVLPQLGDVLWIEQMADNRGSSATASL